MDRPHRYLISVIALCSTLFASVGCKSTGAGSAAKDADGLTIVRIGTEKVTSDAGIFLADKLGYFKAAGLKVRYVRLATAPAVANALATGDLEVAGASRAPGLFSSLGGRDMDRGVQSIAPESNTPVALVAKSHPSGLDPEQRLDVPYLKRLQDFYVGRFLLSWLVVVFLLVVSLFAVLV